MDASGFEHLSALKAKLRKGWTYEPAIPREAVESVADHSYATAMLCRSLCPPELDSGKAVLMALAHDFAESVVPDYTPHDAIAPEEKSRQERAVFERFGDKELLALWLEYDAQKTPLSRFVFAMDKLECVLQACDYSRRYGIDLARWLPSLFPKIPDEYVDAAFPSGELGGVSLEKLRREFPERASTLR